MHVFIMSFTTLMIISSNVKSQGVLCSGHLTELNSYLKAPVKSAETTSCMTVIHVTGKILNFTLLSAVQNLFIP